MPDHFYQNERYQKSIIFFRAGHICPAFYMSAFTISIVTNNNSFGKGDMMLAENVEKRGQKLPVTRTMMTAGSSSGLMATILPREYVHVRGDGYYDLDDYTMIPSLKSAVETMLISEKRCSNLVVICDSKNFGIKVACFALCSRRKQETQNWKKFIEIWFLAALREQEKPHWRKFSQG